MHKKIMARAEDTNSLWITRNLWITTRDRWLCIYLTVWPGSTTTYSMIQIKTSRTNKDDSLWPQSKQMCAALRGRHVGNVQCERRTAYYDCNWSLPSWKRSRVVDPEIERSPRVAIWEEPANPITSRDFSQWDRETCRSSWNENNPKPVLGELRTDKPVMVEPRTTLAMHAAIIRRSRCPLPRCEFILAMRLQ